MINAIAIMLPKSNFISNIGNQWGFKASKGYNN